MIFLLLIETIFLSCISEVLIIIELFNTLLNPRLIYLSILCTLSFKRTKWCSLFRMKLIRTMTKALTFHSFVELVANAIVISSGIFVYLFLFWINSIVNVFFIYANWAVAGLASFSGSRLARTWRSSLRSIYWGIWIIIHDYKSYLIDFFLF